MDSESRDKYRPANSFRSVDGFLSPRPRQPLRQSHLAPRRPLAQHRPTHHTPSSYNPTAHSQLPKPAASPTTLGRNRSPHSERRHRSSMLKYRRIAASFLALILIFSIVSGGWIGFKFLKDTAKVFGGSVVGNIGDFFSSTKLKGESNGRVNILLAGDSADDPGHGGANLTDSIMVVSIDTKNNTGFLLSIPRDLWVNVPTMGHQKINAANEVTTFSSPGYPNGGMGQLEQIVTNDLGIPVDYYALIDYTAFRDAVNAVGGITINIQSPDPRGLFDPNISVADGGPLRLPNGEVTLNGVTALNLARARGDPAPSGIPSYGFPASDFDRTMHQRQMLVALKSKATSLGVISNPLKIGQLFDAIGNNVKTDLNLSDILRLVQITKGVNNSSIQSVTYSETGSRPLIRGYFSSDGQEALIPVAGIDNFSQLQAYYQQLTSSNPVIKEAANVVVLNGTTTAGLAAKAETALATKGISVSSVGSASTTYAKTTIIDNSKGQKPATLALLKSLYGDNVTTKQLETSYSNPDFIVIIGTN